MAVPNTFPSSKSPIKLINNPTRTIQINGQLFIIKKKSILDSFQSDFSWFLKEKSKLTLGKLILIIPPKFDLTTLFDSFLLNEKVKAFWLKLKTL